MKALTVKQPWADLLAQGIKDIENRTWSTNYRGRLLIHSSKTMDWKALNGLVQMGVIDRKNIKEYLPFYGYRTGTFIGEVTLVNCIKNSSSDWAEEGKFHWVIKDPLEFKGFTFPVSGQLGLWNASSRFVDMIEKYKQEHQM